jgi:hypothetical protein
MSTTNPVHITPEGNAWAIKLDGAAAPTSVHPTRGQAVAEAYELVSNLEEAEVIVHQPDGSIGRVVTIRAAFDRLDAELIDDSDDPAARVEALRITPSNERLRAMIGKFPVEGADFDADPADLADQSTAARFAELASTWRADTEYLSSPAAMADHPAYREIIAMGEPAIPLILAELEARPDFWFEALRALTGENPVPIESRGNVNAMASAWLEWGHSHGRRA